MTLNSENLNTDPKLDALLDEALAPEPAPRALVDNILAATGPLIDERRPAVLGRVGFTRTLRRIAAVVILSMEVGAGALLIGISNEAQAIAEVRSELRFIDRLAGATTPLDAEIDLLNVRLDMARAGDDWSSDTLSISRTLDEWDVSDGLNVF